MITNRALTRRLANATLAAGLIFGTIACGSDDDGSSEDTVATTGGSGVVGPDRDLSDLGPLQAQVVTDSLAAAEDQGIDIDEDCYIEAVALLSDEDAQAVIDAGPDGAAEISSEGEDIRDAARLCILFPDTDSTGVTTDSTIGS